MAGTRLEVESFNSRDTGSKEPSTARAMTARMVSETANSSWICRCGEIAANH